MNKGTLEAHGNRAKLSARIYIDDALMLALSRCHMELVLAALIEAIFVIMGKPDTTVRQCPLAMDKWLELVVAPKQRMLGLIIDTNNLMVGIPPDYVAEVLNLINTTWHSHPIASPSGKHKSLQANWAILQRVPIVCFTC